MVETKDSSLGEIDTTYMLHVNPITSSRWDSSSLQKDGLVDTDMLHLGPRGMSKAEERAGGGLGLPTERQELQA